MPRPCTTCEHPRRVDLDRDLVAGVKLSTIAATYDVGRESLRRHRQSHLRREVLAAAERREAAKADARGDDLLDRVDDLQERATALLDRAEAAGELGDAIRAVAECRKLLEVTGRLTGALGTGGGDTTVNVLMLPEWHRVRGAILQALSGFPEARLAVAGALQRLDAEPQPAEAVVR